MIEAVLFALACMASLAVGYLIGYNKPKMATSDQNAGLEAISVRLCKVVESQNKAIVDTIQKTNDMLSVDREQQMDRINADRLVEATMDMRGSNYLEEPEVNSSTYVDLPTEIP